MAAVAELLVAATRWWRPCWRLCWRSLSCRTSLSEWRPSNSAHFPRRILYRSQFRRTGSRPHFYYGGAGTTAIPSSRVRPLSNRSTSIAGRSSPIGSQQNRAGLPTRQSTGVANSQAVAINRQSNRHTGSIAGRNQVSASRTSKAVNRQSFVKNRCVRAGMTRTTGTAIGTGITLTSITTGCLFLSAASGGDSTHGITIPTTLTAIRYDDGNSYPYDYYNGYPDSYYDYSAQ